MKWIKLFGPWMSNLCWQQHQSEQAGLRLHRSPVSLNVVLMDFLSGHRFIIELWRRIWICIGLQPFATRLAKRALSILIFSTCNHPLNQNSHRTQAYCPTRGSFWTRMTQIVCYMYKSKSSDNLSLLWALPLDQNSHRTQASCLKVNHHQKRIHRHHHASEN